MKRTAYKISMVFMAIILAVSLWAPLNIKAANATTVNIDYADEKWIDTGACYIDHIENDIYASFSSSKSNVDDYYMVFDYEDDENYVDPEGEDKSKFIRALYANKIITEEESEDYTAYMRIYLYKMTDEDDVLVKDKVDIYFPLPAESQEHPEDCHYYKLYSGKLTEIFPLQLYSIDDYLYIKQTVSGNDYSSTYFGFVFNDPDSYEEEEEDYDDEDEDEDDELLTPTPTPTIAPTATPTVAPTKAPTPTPSTDSQNPDSKDEASEDNEPDKKVTKAPSPTIKPTATPTPKPTDSNKKTDDKPETTKKDSIPKTGDDFNPVTLISASIISLAIIFAAIKKLKK